jgi:signal transduction histidine kinase
MPDLSGIGLLEQIHERDAAMPVIMMTAFADLETAIDALKKGAFDFIIKPYKPEHLLYAVGKALKFKMFTEIEKSYRNILEEFNTEIETLIAERTMNLMALTVADKVRNPATVIACLCRQMMKSADIPESLRESVTAITEETLKLEKIVADFQNLLTNRESLFTYEALNDLVLGAVSMVEKEALRRKIRLVPDLASRPLAINMQKNLLKTAVVHLLRNALEATGPEGGITIRTQQQDERVMLVISDTGSGIPQAALSKIFDPFFSTREHRFGMGLPLAKQIIAEHMGEISVESAPDKGTTISVSFPLRWKQNTPSPPLCPVAS